MKILLTTDCAINGEFAAAGTICEIGEDTALQLIRMGRASEAPEQQARKPRAGKQHGAS
jgi:hypothetical protein